jgi:hypothetical protein
MNAAHTSAGRLLGAICIAAMQGDVAAVRDLLDGIKVTFPDGEPYVDLAVIDATPIAPKLADALREARAFAVTAIQCAVTLPGFDPAEHVLIRKIDAVLAEWDGKPDRDTEAEQAGIRG